ncbi:MAG TPA: hypothetical protein VHX38_08155 [Pseudonocardiaceae bacterium]|jgi:hypothetical protein|nr:hypothetical protein [Pseudonocardiaceae bacterium]
MGGIEPDAQRPAGPALTDVLFADRLELSFHPVAEPIREPRAKLGGQPCWLETPTWPLSASSHMPMCFVGQFPIPGSGGRVAYLFLTEGPDEVTALTSEPDGGENALLVQPGGRIPDFLAVSEQPAGPSLWRRGAHWDDHVPVELQINVAELDPAQEQALDAEIAAQEAEIAGIDLEIPEIDILSPRGYVGGKPCFWQPHIVLAPPWRFFFQLDGAEGWEDEQYALNLGGGTGYAYLSADGLEGRFYWDRV